MSFGGHSQSYHVGIEIWHSRNEANVTLHSQSYHVGIEMNFGKDPTGMYFASQSYHVGIEIYSILYVKYIR